MSIFVRGPPEASDNLTFVTHNKTNMVYISPTLALVIIPVISSTHYSLIVIIH